MSPLKILVVDDHFSNAYVTGQLFEILGHEVQIVNSGKAALDAVKQSTCPDIIMVDISMPDIDGYELCQKLRNMTCCKTMRIIAQTGWGQEGDFEKAKQAGFDDYLLKPVPLDSIRTLLNVTEMDRARPPLNRSKAPRRRA